MTIGKDDRARTSRSLAESNFRYTGHAVRLHQLAKGLLPMNALDRFVQLLRKIGIEFTNLGCVSDDFPGLATLALADHCNGLSSPIIVGMNSDTVG